jgi:hypothetical protein
MTALETKDNANGKIHCVSPNTGGLSMNIREYQERMDDALGEVKRLLVQSGYYDNQTLENIDCDRDDPDDVQRWNELTNASKLLLKAVDDLNYLPVPYPEEAYRIRRTSDMAESYQADAAGCQVRRRCAEQRTNQGCRDGMAADELYVA